MVVIYVSVIVIGAYVAYTETRSIVAGLAVLGVGLAALFAI